MTIRIKIGRHLSIGRTGVRLHAGPSRLRGSVGGSGTRLYGRMGPLYGIFGGRGRR